MLLVIGPLTRLGPCGACGPWVGPRVDSSESLSLR